MVCLSEHAGGTRDSVQTHEASARSLPSMSRTSFREIRRPPLDQGVIDDRREICSLSRIAKEEDRSHGTSNSHRIGSSALSERCISRLGVLSVGILLS